MPLVGSFSGSVLIKGNGAYHPGVVTIDVAPTGSQNAVFATSTVSSTATGTQNRASYITSSSVSNNPRYAYDPFNEGAITYSLQGQQAAGVITQVTGTTVYISFTSGSFTNLVTGMPFKIDGYGGALGGYMLGQFYITAINSGSGYINLATTPGGGAVTFATSSAGNASGYTWTPTADRPTFVAGSYLPSGFSVNSTGTVSGSYTVRNSGGGNSINPSAMTGGVYSGGMNNTWNNNYGLSLIPTTLTNFQNPAVEFFQLAVSVPYEFRQILTTAYVLSGYSASTPYTNVNRCTASTDSNVDLGSGHTAMSQAYTQGAYSWNYVYCFDAANSVSSAGSTVTSWSMRTETARTTNFSTGWYDSNNSNAVVQQEHYYCWATAGVTIREFNLSTETNSGTPANQTGSNCSGAGGSHETRGIWGNANVSWAYATRTGTGRTAAGPNAGNGNAKLMQNKNPTSYMWGSNGNNTWLYTSFPSDTTTNGYSIPGSYTANEENHTNAQDWGYCIGFYNPAGHQAASYKWIFASATGATGTSNYQGQPANSSGWFGSRD